MAREAEQRRDGLSETRELVEREAEQRREGLSDVAGVAASGLADVARRAIREAEQRAAAVSDVAARAAVGLEEVAARVDQCVDSDQCRAFLDEVQCRTLAKLSSGLEVRLEQVFSLQQKQRAEDLRESIERADRCAEELRAEQIVRMSDFASRAEAETQRVARRQAKQREASEADCQRIEWETTAWRLEHERQLRELDARVACLATALADGAQLQGRAAAAVGDRVRATAAEMPHCTPLGGSVAGLAGVEAPPCTLPPHLASTPPCWKRSSSAPVPSPVPSIQLQLLREHPASPENSTDKLTFGRSVAAGCGWARVLRAASTAAPAPAD